MVAKYYCNTMLMDNKKIFCMHVGEFDGEGNPCKLGRDEVGICQFAIEKNIIGLKIGDVVKSMGNQITVPQWLEVWGADKNFKGEVSNGMPEKWNKVGDTPCIKLGQVQDGWYINTNGNNQSGLVCFVPEKYLGMAILAVQIKKVNNKSVIAEPVDWIEITGEFKPEIITEVNRRHIGETGNKFYDSWNEPSIINDPDFSYGHMKKVTWHKLPACGNPNCGRSSGIHDGLTFGSGKLDEFGFWEKPCGVCAREYEKRHPDYLAWPFKNQEDFNKVIGHDETAKAVLEGDKDSIVTNESKGDSNAK